MIKKKLSKMIFIFLLMAIFIISVLISCKTKLDSHPDEKVHYEAVKYYQKHILPPKFTDDDIKASFSVHGESRLTELDSYYFFVGKFTSLFNNIINNDIVKVLIARSFNLILLAIILVYCYKLYKKESYLFIPFLLTSQVWYIFSYINNDAWAVFLNLIFIYQLFYKDSGFNNYLNMDISKEPKKMSIVGKAILLGLLFYFLLIAKVNYLIATGISAILYLIINNKTVFKKQKLIKIGIVLLIGFLALGIRLGIDYGINRLDRIKNMEQVRVLRADEEFIAPYPAGRTNGTANGNFKWSERGKPIGNVIKNKEFYQKTAFSFIGVYGYMNKYATHIFYYLILGGYLILIVYLIVNNVQKRKREDDFNRGRVIPLILVFLAGILTLGLNIYRCYTYDFQPQGRYLFPIIPLLCALMYNQKKNKVIKIFVFIMISILVIMYVLFGACKLIS